MFDLTNYDSFESVGSTWLSVIEETKGDNNPKILLVGNKSDIPEKK